ncbi:MAG: SagB/ThcOx family dehydrogenase [Chloroflexota bacterium]|nr:MAG: SagB/ThcOx family dehydrogenase [Chloroflexota bacterium]
MVRRWVDLAITLALLGALLGAGVTGVLAEALGVERSIFHRVFSYALFGLGCVHMAFRRRQLWQHVRRAIGRGRPDIPERAAPAGPPHHRVPLPSRRSFLFGLAAGAAGFVVRPWLVPSGSGRWPLSAVLPEPASPPQGSDLGTLYHEWSKPSFSGVLTKPLDWGERPPLYKEYPDTPRVSLPEVTGYAGLSVEEAIRRRRSSRDYTGTPLTPDQLSLLLFAAAGVTRPHEALRAAPSAGAQHPLELYVVVHNVADLSPGVYHYRPLDHALDVLKKGDFRLAMLAASGGQDQASTACAVLVVTGVFQRSRWRYRDRAYRYVLLDAGHLGENVYLQATSLGLGVCGIGAFWDDDVNALVGVDGREEAALYLISVGSVT